MEKNTAKENKEKKIIKRFPFESRQIKDLKGELWKEIPGYEDFYLISNFGRIKALPRDVKIHGGYTRRTPERLKKILIHRVLKTNKYGKKTVYSVVCGVSKDAKKKRIVIARYLYCVFVKAFDLEDFTIKVCFKDGRWYNLRLSNLELVSSSHVIHKTYLDDIRKREGWTHKAKKIMQKTIDGKIIGEYPSIKQAGIATGIDDASIYRVVIGEYKQYKGFIFEEIQ